MRKKLTYYVRVGFRQDETERLQKALEKIKKDGCAWMPHYTASSVQCFIRHVIDHTATRILQAPSAETWIQKRQRKLAYHFVEMEFLSGQLQQAMNETPNLPKAKGRKAAA